MKEIIYNMVTTLDKTAENIVQLLVEKKLTVSTAESCTGGMISCAITSVPGSSEVFGFGFVTYANEAKMKLLGVSGETLGSVGAVSEQTAAEMASGARKASGADLAVSVTGIAGPGGGTEEKPVGTVWIGISSEKRTFAQRYLFDGNVPEISDKRQAIRTQTACAALELLIKEIERSKR